MRRLFVIMMIMVSPLVLAQSDERSSAYVDFGSLEKAYGEPKVMVNIGGALLNLAAALSQGSSEAELLRNLSAVRVDVYDTKGDRAPALERAQALGTRLQQTEWATIVRVKEQDEFVQIFVKLDGEIMAGFVVMAVDEAEAVFINILGNIDPSRLQEVMKRFDVDIDIGGAK